ncbi:ABC transporter substrate-binding protein [Streptomyces sp. 549]|uniref:peptide ABC transporter substrate-binding protein n=1 Tax=Streptomyces sp. 549 TaxID=3049076 RepID=UPI0024C293DC|nr:ABC transporter substrate-binding protein [Streptomyces sp. 549]MDK1476741.1 ABC transporter substrate-binding protein [Streptomyces sp. 549]
MRGAKSAKWVASAIVVALAATACGGGSGDSDEGGKGGYDPDGIVKLANSEPQALLQPANSQDTAGGQVIKGLFTPLVDWDEKGELQMMNAESVESDDAQTWTVKLKKGWTFHDGEEVTAKSYVDAWNWAANIENEQKNSYWFEDIKGYEDVHPEKGKPSKTEMEGLKVVDDQTFTIELKNKVSYFDFKLAYNCWSPLPSKFYDDPEAYGKKPVGNGPYKFKSWDRKKKISVVRFDDYKGPDKAKNGGVDYVNYQTAEAEYDAVKSDKADIITMVPPRDLPKYKDDLGDRAVDAPMAGIQTLQLNFKAKGWEDVDPLVLRGISQAIDRDTITKTVLNGTRDPANSLTAPNLQGHEPEVGGDYAKFDPEAAKKNIKDGGGVPNDEIFLQYNADGGHKEWVEAVCNSIRQATGVECTPDSKPDFQTDLNIRESGDVKTFYRGGWVLDYPVNVNFLKEQYFSTAGANYGKFSNKKVDELFKKGDQAETLEETVKAYQEAEKYMFEEVAMPAIPLWYYKTNAGHSTKVDNVKFDLANFAIVQDVQVKK